MPQMIISHRLQFIFLKSRKTAGTSVEIALTSLCGDDDVITPISPDDEDARWRFAERGAQNFEIPQDKFSSVVAELRRVGSNRRTFFNHMPATAVKRAVSDEVWRSYFKFSIERNPFDRAISRYYWSTRELEQRPPFDSWIETASNLSNGRARASNWSIYAIGEEIAVDYVIRYETLSTGLAEVSKRINTTIVMPERKAKAGTRLDHRPPSEVLSDVAIARITRECSRELLHFGYAL